MIDIEQAYNRKFRFWLLQTEWVGNFGNTLRDTSFITAL